MRIRAIAPLTAALLLLAACGSDDDASDTTGLDVAEQRLDEVPESVPVRPDDCEDEPDPADYPEGEVPAIIRPCDPPDELVVHEIRPGAGIEASAGSTVIVDYAGVRVETGELFDESYTRGIPIDFVLGRGAVIAGWDEGLAGVQAGGLYKVEIPTDLAYGDAPPAAIGGVIQPGDDLAFVVEVRAVIAPVTAADAPLDAEVEPSDGATAVTTVDLEEGDGALVEPGDTAVVHMLLVRGDNETVLLNTWDGGDPLQVVIAEGGSLPGVVEGLEGARVGTVRAITMPPELAFGPDGNPSMGLPAGRDLIVIAEVVGVF